MGQPQDVRPLSGIRVLELTSGIAGPAAGRHLSAMGAEVIRLDSLKRPDALRLTGSGWARDQHPGVRLDTGPMFSEFMAGKRSLAVDAKTPRGRDVVLKVVEQCDVFIMNMSAAVPAQLGLDTGTLLERRPDLICCLMPGFGMSPSRYHDYRAWGPNLGPLAGLDNLTGWPDRAQSGLGTASCPDYTSAGHAAVAILAALLHRDATGEGQVIDLSQFESTVALLGPLLALFDDTGVERERSGNGVTFGCPRGVFPTVGDDQWIAIACSTDDQWAALCEVADGEPFAADRTLAHESVRRATGDALTCDVSSWTSRWPAFELAELLQGRGVPAGEVHDQAGVLTDPQVRARRTIRPVPSARFGRDLITAFPPRMSGAATDLHSTGPMLGKDNDDILGNLLGLDEAERRQLAEDGVIDSPVHPEVRLRRPYVDWVRYIIPDPDWAGVDS
jgi:benzylsuccinate CoA-transferase BbsF subunit